MPINQGHPHPSPGLDVAWGGWRMYRDNGFQLASRLDEGFQDACGPKSDGPKSDGPKSAGPKSEGGEPSGGGESNRRELPSRTLCRVQQAGFAALRRAMFAGYRGLKTLIPTIESIDRWPSCR